MAYIYKLLDEDGETFYIGKTINTRNRLNGHLRLAREGKRLPVSAKIRKLLRQGYRPQIEIVEEVDDDVIDERERYHISSAREEGINLCNLTEGGDGGITPEIAKKVVETRRRNGTNRHSEETRRKIGAAHKGKRLSQSHWESLSRAWNRTPEQWSEIGLKISRATKGVSHIKKYICTSPEGTEYVTERGLTCFCEDHGLSRSKMCMMANGKLKHYLGWACKHAEGSE